MKVVLANSVGIGPGGETVAVDINGKPLLDVSVTIQQAK